MCEGEDEDHSIDQTQDVDAYESESLDGAKNYVSVSETEEESQRSRCDQNQTQEAETKLTETKMAWLCSVHRCRERYGLRFLPHCAKALSSSGEEMELKPGEVVWMKGCPVGTFGVRHVTPLAGCGGETICIISDREEMYKGIDSHLGTMRSLLRGQALPKILYSTAISKDGSLYSTWTRKHFETLIEDSRAWQENYSQRSTALFTKVYVFYRVEASDKFIFFGRYSATSFDGSVLSLSPLLPRITSNISEELILCLERLNSMSFEEPCSKKQRRE